MGLDMYLTAEKYIFNDETEISSALANVGFKSKGNRVRSVSVDIMKWRKSNQVHRWFVENVQKGDDDCKRYYVTLEKLAELVDLCKQVLANNALAETLLPTQQGFFFGSDEYDEMYFLDLQDTVLLVEPVLQDREWLDWDFYYQSSW